MYKLFKTLSFGIPLKNLLLIFAAIECVLLTIGHQWFGSWAQPVIYSLVAITPGILILKGRYALRVAPLKPSFFKFILFVAGIALGAWLVYKMSKEYKLDAQFSDIIPTVQLFIKRLFRGDAVYTLITEFGYPLAPTYLPCHWLPFVPSELLHIDPRVWAFVLGSLAWLPLILKSDSQSKYTPALVLTPFVIYLLWLIAFPSEIGYSIEWLMAGYYLLFVWALAKNNPWYIALSLTLILLSRFSLILWIPVVLPLIFYKAWRSKMIIIVSATCLAILAIYVLPFLSKDWSALKNAQNYYSVAALKEWGNQAWQQSHDDAFQLSRGYGFAYWVYKLAPGTLPHKIEILKSLQLIVCAVFVLGVSVWFYFSGIKKLEMTLFLLGSLKIYLCLFYVFIQVPYPYLFMVPLAVTTGLVFLLKPTESTETNQPLVKAG